MNIFFSFQTKTQHKNKKYFEFHSFVFTRVDGVNEIGAAARRRYSIAIGRQLGQPTQRTCTLYTHTRQC